jgi:hypothetical protein
MGISVDDGKLRTELRKIFDRFDEDKSGHISTVEMTAMVKTLKMAMSSADIKKMMAEADPDGSGEVDFDEFCSSVKHQIEAGHGGALTEVVKQAGGMFGWLGGLFGFAEPEPPPPPPPPAPKKRTASPPRPAPAAPSNALASPKPVVPSPPPPAAEPTGGSPPASSSAVVSSGGGGFFGFGGGSATPAAVPSASLYDQYMSPSEARANRKVDHGETRTTRLRSTGVKLSCYLNTEVDRGRATVISLPEECDTLGEVLPKIQQQMQLDKRMCYAAELYLPDGSKIATYKALIDAVRTTRPNAHAASPCSRHATCAVSPWPVASWAGCRVDWPW